MKRVVVGFIALTIIHVSFSMEPDPAKKIDSPDDFTQSFAIVPASQNSYLDYIGQLSNYVVEKMFDGAQRATKTAFNYAFDSEAIRMLGWPLNDPAAQKELEIARKKYKAVFTITDPEESKAVWTTIANRTGYLTRAYGGLDAMADGVQFAHFCREEHGLAMNDFLKKGFIGFLERRGVYLNGENLFTSSTDLARIKLSDEELCNIIGWGKTENAKKILMRCIQAYQIKGIIRKTKGNLPALKTVEGRTKFEISEDPEVIDMIHDIPSLTAFIEYRENFIKNKIYQLFKFRFDTVSLTCIDMMILAHCLKYHTYVMSPSLQTDMAFFIKEQEALSTKIVEEFRGKKAASDDIPK